MVRASYFSPELKGSLVTDFSSYFAFSVDCSDAFVESSHAIAKSLRNFRHRLAPPMT